MTKEQADELAARARSLALAEVFKRGGVDVPSAWNARDRKAVLRVVGLRSLALDAARIALAEDDRASLRDPLLEQAFRDLLAFQR